MLKTVSPSICVSSCFNFASSSLIDLNPTLTFVSEMLNHNLQLM